MTLTGAMALWFGKLLVDLAVLAVVVVAIFIGAMVAVWRDERRRAANRKGKRDG